MTEKNRWDIEQLQERARREEEARKKNEEDLKELMTFKTETVERLKTVFGKLRDIERSSKWVSQTFFTLILGGIITAVGAFLKWLFTGG